MSALWTAAEAIAATGGTADRDFVATGVSIDSRSIAPGDLFIALHGPLLDGHAFVADALAKGAAAAMVDRAPAGIAATAPLLRVGDTLAALTALGGAARARSAARIIGVTGSVGKTGTKEALRLALAGQGATHASASSFNNHWGLPLSLARMPRNAAFGVFEIGMNHAGELAELARVLRPAIALVTTIEAAHLGNFPSVEAIADAKAEIFLGMTPDGTAILNRDNPHYERLAAAARRAGITRIIGFGEHPDAAIRMIRCRLGATASAVGALVMGDTLDYTVAQPGRHWAMNSLAVLGAVAAAGGEVAAAAAALGRLPGLPGRGQRHRLVLAGGGSCELIDESYNANPASMQAAFAVLATSEPGRGGRRIAILGDMLELGRDSPALHAGLAAPLAAAGVDLVHTAGAEMAHLRAALPARMRGAHRATSAELAPLAAATLRPGDVVTVKGSLGSRMAVIVKHILAGAAAPAATAAG